MIGPPDDQLSLPGETDIEFASTMSGDVAVLGAGGKMGPTLVALLARALERSGNDRVHIYAVSRFADGIPAPIAAFRSVTPIKADLLNRDDVAGLPDANNVIHMCGQKFGGTAEPATMWAINTLAPALVCEQFPNARIAVFSSGNVYPFTPDGSTPPSEASNPEPVGEYAASVLARERIFEYYGSSLGVRSTVLRLNYAIDPRYGVIHDIVKKLIERKPIDLTVSEVNVIWQRDANSIAIRSLEHATSPPTVLNVTGPTATSVRWIAERASELLGVAPEFTGGESGRSLLSDSSRMMDLMKPDLLDVDEMVRITTDWLAGGGESLNKPTMYERTDGRF